jgi:protein O-GlcNAc transferase
MAPLTVQQTFDLALQHYKTGRLHEAEDLCRQILARDTAHFGALHLLGLIAHQLRRDNEAVDLIRQAIALKPKIPEAHFNFGNVLKDTGQMGEAAAAFRRAIALRPGYAEAFINLGIVLKVQGQLDEAIAAFRRAIDLNPNFPEAHSNLAATLQDNGQFDEAIAACRNAIALNPNLPEAHINLGNALKDTGRLDECLAAYRQAIALRPSHAPAHSTLLYTMQFHPAYDAKSLAEEHHRWNLQHAEPLRKFIQPHPNDRTPDRRLRIGYVSPDFHDHVVGRNLLPLFRQHDRRQFEMIVYSQTASPDAITSEFQHNADRWHNIVGQSDEQVAHQIRQDQIDILVDLTLHMRHNRLLVFARKPAPVQATFAGYPGSTGLSAIDYRLSDPYLDPPAVSPVEPSGMDESIYSEQTIRLPDSFWCYDPLTTEPAVNGLPALENGCVTFGCLNNFCKFNDHVLALWAKVLRPIENSRLILLSPPGSHRLSILDRFQREDIVSDRIEFVSFQSHQKYLETYHRIDLGLDTFPYNGHTTSLDSFWMGVPVITLIGNRAVARAGWCQLSNLGLAELAGQTPDDFVRIATELATDLPRLQQLRSTLRTRMQQSPLMDAPKFARNIEAAYRRMWHTWCKSVSDGN